MATNGKTDHFDGEPDQQYFEDIQKYMQRMFSGWDCDVDQSESFLQRWSPTISEDYRKKFPFSTERFGVPCYTKKVKFILLK